MFLNFGIIIMNNNLKKNIILISKKLPSKNTLKPVFLNKGLL